jgi:hypothetical protein
VARKKTQYQVFVSHATADKWIAAVLCDKLEAIGAVTFRDDRDIDGGDDIPDRLREQIQRSQEPAGAVNAEIRKSSLGAD